MMWFDWQAHLVLALFLFLLAAPIARVPRAQGGLLVLAAALTFVPVDGLPLAIAVRSLSHDLSISLLVLLAALALARLRLVRVEAGVKCQVLLVFAVLGLVLYPASLGLSYLDPYRWGYQPVWLLLAIAALTLGLLCLGNWLGVAMLVLATLAYALRGDGPGNYWNYLLDPLLVLYALLGCLSSGLAAAYRRLVGQPARNALSSHHFSEIEL
ncbi:hypothetical protein [Pseudomonas nicosulfuronedens]